MSSPTPVKNKTVSVRNSIGRPPLRRRVSLTAFALALACFVPSPPARALNPAPDGGYPNANTAEGVGALNSLNTNSGGGNTAMGYFALQTLTAGSNNTAIGVQALNSNTGEFNTAIGAFALYNNTTADFNTATGDNALLSNTTGGQNTANGASALQNNTNGSNNTAMGSGALASLGFDGFYNTAVGSGALSSQTSGCCSTAIGFNALFNSTGGSNTAVGDAALFSNTNGVDNTATGGGALYTNTTGNYNTANGVDALYSNIGSNNTADGFLALENNKAGHDNIAVGFQALKGNTTGNSNIALGSNAGSNLTTGSNNIDIGASGAAEGNTIRIGKQGTQKQTFIAGISGVAVSGSTVVVNSSGKLGVAASSARFKEAIKPMDKTSEAVFALKPVTFRYKQELDPDGIAQFGLVAEQVEKVNPDLVARDNEGKIYTVRYEAVNAMLLNEFIKEHRKGQKQDATITQLKSAAAQQQKEIRALRASLKKQEAQIQKVSAQIEATKPAPQVLVNNP
jgi:trimeric autotransporter adhesin